MDRSRASECRRSVVVVVIARDGMFLRDAARKLESENARLDVAARERRRRREEEARRRDEIEKRKIEASRESSRAARDAKRALEASRAMNEGVSYDATLIAVASEEAMRRGIRARGEDKAQLPASASASVGASRSGRAHFKVARGERRTHVGVLDYGTIDSGSIGLPSGVMEALGMEGGEEVRVSYAALPSATKMTLKPRMNDFARDFVNEDVREVLERVMMGRSAATIGDEVRVERGERRYELVVTAVEPDDGHGAVSLLETDVEVELEPSEEYERVTAEIAARETRRKEEFEKAKEALAEREREKARVVEAFEARKRALVESIKPEPSEPRGTPGIFVLRFSLPNGAVKTRRFAAETFRTRDAFDYARSLDDEALRTPAGGFVLATRAKDVELREDEELSDDLAKNGCAALDAQTLLFVRVSI